jgi:hypothetical protein
VQKGVFDLSAFRQQSIQLIFRASGDGSTAFGIDDVSVLTACPNSTALLAPSVC